MMASNEVKISVTVDEKDAIKGLSNIQNKAKETGEMTGVTAEKISADIGAQTKNTENYLSKMMDFGGRVATSLLNDFKSLASINALQGAMKFSDVFKQSISESVELSDVIRKLGSTLGIARSNFDSFAGNMTKGLGEIGLGSEVAAHSLQGLVDTPVRGEKALIEYSKVAGQLASISMEKGQEGQIAKGISNVIQAKGGNVNDTQEVARVADDLKRVRDVTGKSATESLNTMNELFGSMTSEARKKISTRGIANLAATEQVAGPGSTNFLKLLLTQGSTANSAFRAQGFGNVFNDKGLDTEKFGQAARGILARVGGDATLAAKTLGIQDDETAKGFVRLVESLDKVKAAQNAIANSNETLTETYKSSMTLGEAFMANLNRIKRVFAEPISAVTGFATKELQKASEGDKTAGAVVAGSGILAAVLAGSALKGIGGGLFGGAIGGLVKGAAAEKITGKEVQPVYVVNASEIGGGGIGGAIGGAVGKGGILAGLGSALTSALGVGLAGFAGYKVGEMVEPTATNLLDKTTAGKTEEGFEGNALERLFFKLDQLLGGETSSRFNQQQKILIELNKHDLKATPGNSRGPSH